MFLEYVFAVVPIPPTLDGANIKASKNIISAQANTICILYDYVNDGAYIV